ncbi:MAG TPA: glycosyltransferase family 2 protein, partial [Polyangiales bacterium]|nr:glycosyltransferase family 2 protein [Polyangiales bacterium]
ERTVRSIPEFVDRVLVVDDGSADGTASVARALLDPRVQVVSHAQNRGVGAALCTGYRLALAAGMDAVAVMAGDAQMHPDDLLALLTPVVSGQVDYAKGDRLSHPEVRARMPWTRHVGNCALSALTRLAIGLPVSDSQCGYTVLSRRALERLPLDALWCGYGYPNDLLGWLRNTGATIRDVTVRPVYGQEQSGIGLRHALLVIPYVLLRVLWRRVLFAFAQQTLPRATEMRADAAYSAEINALPVLPSARR